MTWISPRPRRVKALEVAQACWFRRRHHGRVTGGLRDARTDWLYGRFNLVPRTVNLLDGTVYDVGANVGDWTAALLRLAPSARVVAVEPTPMLAEELRRRFSQHTRVEVVQAALSDTAGDQLLHIAANSHNNSLRKPRDMNSDYGVDSGWEEVERVVVPATTLDDIVSKFGKPVLLKIDVQGFEIPVLRGGLQALDATAVLLIEVTTKSHYEDDALFGEIEAILGQRGLVRIGLSDPWRHAVTGEPLWFDACYVQPKSRM